MKNCVPVETSAIRELDEEEIFFVSGGILPLAIAIAGLALVAFSVGYQIGKDSVE